MMYAAILYLACAAVLLCEVEAAPRLPWHT